MTMTRWMALLLVLVGAGAAVFLWPSEERRVWRRLQALAEMVSVPPGETDLARLARAQRLRASLVEEVRVDFEHLQLLPVSGRDGVAALAARRWPQAADGLTVQLEDVVVRLGDDGVRADARFKARVLSRDSSDPTTLDGRMLSLTLQKVEGEWLVASVRVMQGDDAIR
jgi:hypothetical protein